MLALAKSLVRRVVANPFSSLEAKFVVLPKRGVCGYVLLVEGGGLGCLQVKKGGYLRSGKHPVTAAPCCDEGGVGGGIGDLGIALFP